MSWKKPKGRKDAEDITQQLYLKIQPQPPACPPVNQLFEVNVFLVDENDQPKCGNEYPLVVSLVFADNHNEEVPRNGIIVVDPRTPAKIDRNGCGTLRLAIKDLPMSFNSRPFALKISSAFNADVDPHSVEGLQAALRAKRVGRPNYLIASAFSDKVIAVKHHLVLEPGYTIPDTAYKDEGGEDKFLEIRLVLVDLNGDRITDREVPLKLSLLYANRKLVGTQDLLAMRSNEEPKIDRSGSFSCHCRIKDVSKNHQKQAFRIQVSPNTVAQPSNFDIGAFFSEPIEVKSKRKRKTQQAQQQSAAEGSDDAKSLSSGSGKKRRSSRVRSVPNKDETWFIKTEQYNKPFLEVKPHLEAHREWIAKLRESGHCITSGHRLDSDGCPGEERLMIFTAQSYAAAEALMLQDPLVANDCVIWQLNGWVPEVGGLELC
uniref:YCII-related domain-containing protein n=1 Tax=Fibrocapsa japonica TaxID=94617 RepID=A0A7S2V404_9STRA|mmetsp:Transcript_23752/g.34535  ORF Transcript_23752/g.34535 Transcript_23752/m.34535 type:complete len:431 (+) Transcript_23752:65-1357(+)